jgi:glucose/mannose-6-phosphate isomerase
MIPGDGQPAARGRWPTGGILDDPEAMSRADPGGVLGLMAGLPAQVAEAWRISRTVSLPWGRPAAVAVLGMGGSAIGADLARAIWSDRLAVPVEVVRDYDLPAWVGSDTLVVASSYSGATEETVSCLGTALERRCPVAVMTTGGPMREVAERAGLPVAVFPAAGSPRASMGYSLGLLGGLLERAGVLRLDEAEIAAGVAEAQALVERCRPDVPTEDNPAKQLAWSLVDRLVIVIAGGFLAPVARRWKAQLNENGKSTAVFEELPEATHNTVVGLEQPESVRDHLFVVTLDGASVHPRTRLRARLVRELLDVAGIAHHEVVAPGEQRLGQALSAVVLGDHVSAYLAFTYGVDPTPVEAIDYIKASLAAEDRGALSG